MSELDADESGILGQARRGLSPTAADRARVAQALRAQLTHSPASSPGAAAPRSPAPGRLTTNAQQAARWISLAGVIALSAGVGYWQGYRSGTKGREVVTVLRSAPRGPAPAVTLPSSAIPPAPPVTRGEASAPPHLPNPRPARSNASPRRSLDAPAPGEPLGLDEEVRQLRRIEKSIREQNPRLALVLLDELEHDIPAGQLLEEREAASVMANCQLQATEATSNARAFVIQHARSAYVARVSEICRLPAQNDERISPTPGTNLSK